MCYNAGRGDSMAVNWEEKREAYEKSFQKLLAERKVPGRYFIPEEYKSAVHLYSPDARRQPNIKEKMIEKEKLYYKLQNKFPDATGKMLAILFKSLNETLFVKPMNIPFQQVVTEIFEKGLPMQRDEFISEFSKDNYFPELLSKIYDCSPYRNTYGCLLIRIPKELELPIYYKDKDSGQLFLLPGYIYGFIPVDSHHIGDIAKNPNYSVTHRYDPTGLYYDALLTKEQWAEQNLENQKKKN